MSRFCFCNCPAGFSAEPERHAPDCPGRSGAGKARTPVPATTPALKVTAAEELDAVLHWRNKHAVAIKERDALQRMLNQRDEQIEALKRQPQGEPVATPLDYGSLDAVKRLALCRGEVPAPVGMVLPERLDMTDGLHSYEYVTGHNAAIDKVLGVKS